MRARGVLAVLLAAAAGLGCDRRVEPYDPAEKPELPDLTRIFPEGSERAAGPSPQPTPPGGRRGAPPLAAEAGDSEVIRGTVVLAAELEGRVPAGAVLFVIARRGSGGPPVAVKRIASPRFPVRYELGPGDRMIAAIPFEGPMRLSARVDSDGNASTRSAGDLQGAAPAAVEPGAESGPIVLDQVL